MNGSAFEKTGIYMRLSRDDEKAGESASIEHQRLLLREFVAQKGGTIVSEYADDGYSGTDFDRPAVKRMLEDAQVGKIDTIVVKDLSRFGRNYIQVGQYIDYIFPAYGVRFIAISDNLDTADRQSAAMDMMPIMNVFNEWHAANTSKKIRAVLDASRRSGRFVSWSYPYGYKAGTDEKRTAVVDGEAAEIVRCIFDMRVQGHSAAAIARKLTDGGIENPTAHFRRLDGGKWNRPSAPYWRASTVSWILSNPIYIGSTVQRKTTSVSYKNRKTVSIPESERVIKENAHEPIISREIWDKVQAMKSSVSRGKADGENTVHALSGLLVCADCLKKLKLKTSSRTYKDSDIRKYSFACRTYTDLGKKYCSSHAITEREIEAVVLRDIKSMMNGAAIDEQKARERFARLKAKKYEQSGYAMEKKLDDCKNRLSDLDKLIKAAFEERVLGSMPESVWASLCDKYQAENAAVEKEIGKIEKALAEKCSDGDTADEYIRRLKVGGCDCLTRELCLQLISFITVGEKTDGGREIHIYYNLNGNKTK